MATTESLKKNNICTMPTQIEKSVKRFYKQIYRKDWEEHVIFKGWLSPVAGDKYKAECIACNKELLAHRLTLLKHASSAKHLKKVAVFKEKTYSKSDGNKNIDKNPTNTLDNCFPRLINLNGIAVDTFSIQNNNPGFSENTKEVSAETQLYINGGASNASTETYENDAPNLINKKTFIKPQVINEIIPEDIGIIIRTESYVDISDSSEAINFKQGYVANNSPSNKTNTNILSCNSTFLASKTDDAGNPNVLNKITSYPIQVSTRVTDYSRGISVANLNITLYKLSSGKWICVSEGITDDVGRSNLFPKNESFFSSGCYKLHYDVSAYYELQNLKSYFPFIEISFLINFPNETHHIPLMISPNGYTTYRSLDF